MTQPSQSRRPTLVGSTQPVRPLGKDHLPGCEALPLSSPRDMLYPDTSAGGYDDEGIYFIRCVEGCPVLASVKKRGRELAEEHGW